MTILFSPAESKRPGGDLPPIGSDAFCCESLYPHRESAIARYRDFVLGADAQSLSRLTGIKKQADAEAYRADPFTAPTMKAITRYCGVAYDHLDYASLPDAARRYVDSHTVVFSNVFGPLLASDRVPDYKLKQGEPIGTFRPESHYKAHFSDALDARLEGGAVLDLRAGFYEKFYTLKRPYLSLKFIKGGKVVSHWAKAWRGKVLREMALQEVESESEFEAMEIEGVTLSEIRVQKHRREYILEIRDS